MALYTWDLFCTVDGFGSFVPPADWGASWGEQGPGLLEHGPRCYERGQRLVLGAGAYRDADFFSQGRPGLFDPWAAAMLALRSTVFSSTLGAPLALAEAAVERGDAVETVARMKAEDERPISSPSLRAPSTVACRSSSIAPSCARDVRGRVPWSEAEPGCPRSRKKIRESRRNRNSPAPSKVEPSRLKFEIGPRNAGRQPRMRAVVALAKQ